MDVKEEQRESAAPDGGEAGGARWTSRKSKRRKRRPDGGEAGGEPDMSLRKEQPEKRASRWW